MAANCDKPLDNKHAGLSTLCATTTLCGLGAHDWSPRKTGRVPNEDEELSLRSYREKEALLLICQLIQADALHQAPSHRELLRRLNAVLPLQASGRPALIGTQQTVRIAHKLRRLGLLIYAPGRTRNLVPTARGRQVAREWAQASAAARPSAPT